MSTDLSTTTLTTTPANDWYPSLTYPTYWPTYPTYPTYVQPAVTYTITQTPRCAWCQGTHTDKCPDLKSVTYRRDGTVERVEFFDRPEP